jgi:hypothetical protein
LKILAFDPAKTTGFAFFDTSRDHSAIQCGVLEMPDKADPYYTGDQLGLKVTRLIKDFGKPDFAILEEQSLAQIGNSNAAAIIYAWGSSLAIVATLSNHGVPYGTITPGSWRKMFFGASFKPPQKPAKPGKKPENDWKAAAVSECERLGIVIPSRKTIAHNACEAAALAICWRGAKLHAKRYEGAFMNLLQQRNTRPSADLFGATA